MRQSVHSARPVASANFPALQAEHEELPNSLVDLPWAQRAHVSSLRAAVAAENFPNPHFVQVPPAAGLYVPIPQAAQAAESGELLSPTPQSSQSDGLSCWSVDVPGSALDFPAGQTAQVTVPEDAVYLPTPQTLQSDSASWRDDKVDRSELYFPGRPNKEGVRRRGGGRERERERE